MSLSNSKSDLSILSTQDLSKKSPDSLSSLNIQINDYYKLKAKYDESIMKIKKKIKNNTTLTKKYKQKEFANTKFKCVNCNQYGGTIFDMKKNNLSAICGASNKCDLNISIDKKTYYNIRDEKTNVEEEINLLKRDIIKTKLDFLFNYIDEKEVTNEFTIQKEDYDTFSKGLIITQKQYIDIVDNIEKTNLLKESIKILHEKILEIKDLEKQYIETMNTQLLEDIITIYKIDIIPLNNKIRNLKYSYYNIVKDEEENNIIIKMPYTLDKLFLQNYQ